ncbi:MAG: hypothetical protein RJA36_3336 [Pseudomonadota bacterium]
MALVIGGYVLLMAWIGLLMALGLKALMLMPPVPYVGGVLVLAVAGGAIWLGIWSFGKALRL